MSKCPSPIASAGQVETPQARWDRLPRYLKAASLRAQMEDDQEMCPGTFRRFGLTSQEAQEATSGKRYLRLRCSFCDRDQDAVILQGQGFLRTARICYHDLP